MKMTRTIARYLLAALLMAATGVLHAAEMNCGRVVVFTDRDIYIAGEQVLFTLHITGGTGSPNAMSSELAYLLLRDSRQGQVAKVCMKTTGGMTYGSISLPDTLATGYYQLVAFTNRMRNCGEECYFTKELIIANLFDKELTALSPGNSVNEKAGVPEQLMFQSTGESLLNINGLKATYARGEEISFSVPGNSESGNMAALTVSVAEEEPWHGKTSAYSNSQNCFTPLTEVEYLPETRGQIIRGKVTDRATGVGVRNCCVLLSAKDTAVNLQYAYTGSNGIFCFRLSDYYQQKDLVIQLLDTVLAQKSEIEIEDRFVLRNTYVPSGEGLSSVVVEYIRKSQDIVKVQRIYGQLPKVQAAGQETVNVIRPALYYKHDQQVFPGAYEPLGNFSEIAKELLPTVRARKTASGTILEVIDKAQQGFFSQSAALFIDGIYRHDNHRLLPMGSAMIRSIEVVNSQRVYGTLTFPGILAVVTQDSTGATVTDRSSVVFRTETYSGNTVLQHQDLPVNTTLPDFRQLLLWQPAIQPDQAGNKQIKFRASQHTGTFIISIRAIGAGGEITREDYRITIR